MTERRAAPRLAWGSLLFASAALVSAADLPLAPIPRFAIPRDPLTITRPVECTKPFTVAGEHGAILGQQNGSFEAWQFPVKILSQFEITAELADESTPIPPASHASVIEVAPAMTTITYSHAAFTIKQRMFAPSAAGAGAVVLFEIASARPLRLTFRFHPDVDRMWPAPNFGPPDPEWVKQGDSGYYLIHTTKKGFDAAVAMPRAQHGVLAPSQERPRSWPVELKLAFDPKKDSDLFFPLLLTLGGARELADLNARIPALFTATQDYYAHFSDSRLTVETPDAQFDRAIRWAEIAINQCRVKFHQETGLAAGFNESGNSMRPGFGWFFGRDTLWTLYAIHAYGDFPLARDAIEFLIRRQRDDGKIMHEYSQTADLVGWKATSYFYAAADSTPLFVMAMEDYVNTSGDRAFLGKHWDAVKRAYAFTRTHDSDGDGIYENTEGTGWVESWPPGMPHQEIYLAALDQQSAGAMSRLAVLMNDDALAANARQRAEKIRAAIEREYYEPAHQFYAFSRNANGTLDHAATIYPAVAWWTGRFALAHSGPMLTRWASSEFSADWGTRDLSNSTPFYDPISYHQGSIWPLFTGWVSLAEYRAGRPLSGYAHLMQNADLTWAQDLGAVTELLSGDFFQPLGRSTPHQLWSSGMLLSPALRGLFGLDWDALHKTLRLALHLPANWDSARLRNVPLGDAHFDVEYLRQAGQLLVRAHSNPPEVLCLVPQTAAYTDCSLQPAATHEVAIPLPPVELALPHELPLPGAQTADLKVLDEEVSPARVSVSLEAPGGTVHDLVARWNSANVRVSGAERIGDKVSVEFPPGAGYQHKTITFSVQQGLP